MSFQRLSLYISLALERRQAQVTHLTVLHFHLSAWKLKPLRAWVLTIRRIQTTLEKNGQQVCNHARSHLQPIVLCLLLIKLPDQRFLTQSSQAEEACCKKPTRERGDLFLPVDFTAEHWNFMSASSFCLALKQHPRYQADKEFQGYALPWWQRASCWFLIFPWK